MTHGEKQKVDRAMALLAGLADEWFAKSEFAKMFWPEQIVRAVKMAHMEGLYYGRHSTVEGTTDLARDAVKIIAVLHCPGCHAQGAEMAAPGKCCRDADCDAGWFGIGCDEIKAVLDRAMVLMPEVLVEAELEQQDVAERVMVAFADKDRPDSGSRCADCHITNGHAVDCPHSA